MSEKTLVFKQTNKINDIVNIVNHNAEVFTATTGFSWSLDNIKKELKEGWKLYSVSLDEDIVAALFIKIDNGILYTKNTPIKLQYQGNGFSHLIKEFYEEEALNLGLKSVFNYCPSDNFRMISLNERHDYKRTGKVLGKNKDILEWEKKINKKNT
jgi:hypothetical protein